MSEQQISTEQQEVVTPQQVQAANNANRGRASRPGWIAGLCVLAFLGGLALFMYHF
jgi:hypothetical protein